MRYLHFKSARADSPPPPPPRSLDRVKEGDVVGHNPRALASTKQGTGIVRHFLTKNGSKTDVKLIGAAVNRGGGYGMEDHAFSLSDRKGTLTC